MYSIDDNKPTTAAREILYLISTKLQNNDSHSDIWYSNEITHVHTYTVLILIKDESTL